MHDDWQRHPARPPAGSVLCRTDEIPDGGGRLLAIGDGNEPFRIVLLRSGDRVFAWYNRCPHFGVPLALKDEWLILRANEYLGCNVHYARFRWQDGYCDNGECVGDSLQAIPLELRDGRVLMGTPP